MPIFLGEEGLGLIVDLELLLSLTTEEGLDATLPLVGEDGSVGLARVGEDGIRAISQTTKSNMLQNASNIFPLSHVQSAALNITPLLFTYYHWSGALW